MSGFSLAKCGREESNLHVFWTLEPESSASANSATAAARWMIDARHLVSSDLLLIKKSRRHQRVTPALRFASPRPFWRAARTIDTHFSEFIRRCWSLPAFCADSRSRGESLPDRKPNI